MLCVFSLTEENVPKKVSYLNILNRLDKGCRNLVCRLYFELLDSLGQTSKELNKTSHFYQ